MGPPRHKAKAQKTPKRRGGANALRLTTLSDVAQHADVSLATASRALNPDSDHSVNAATRARVQAAATRLSYRPNPMARALRTRRMPTIAIVVHDVSDPYFAEIVRGATRAASAKGFLTVVCSSDRDPDTELRYVEMLLLSRVSGVIFAGGGLEEANYRRTMREHGRSMAQYGGAIVALAPRAEQWPSELVDNRSGARMVTEHLLTLGHTAVAMIGGPATLRTSRERELGYAEAMKVAGAKPWIVASDFTRAGGAVAMARLLADRPPTAVFVASDVMALGALAELRHQGIGVPDEISVAGFDDIPGLEFTHPTLTTVRVPMAELGAAGVARLLGELDGERQITRVRLHPVELVIRESTGPVPTGQRTKG